MLELVVRLTLFGLKRGGLPQPVKNGLRPSFSYAGELVACEVWVEQVGEFVPLDKLLRARIKLPYGAELGWRFAVNDSFRLNIASQVIGEGSVLSSEEG